MKTVPLSEACGYTQPEHTASSDEAKLYAEIAERMLELIGSTSISRFNKWLGVLASLQLRDHEAEVWFLRFMTGDVTWLTISYTDIGKTGARSKQAVEQSFDRAMIQLREVKPALADAVVEFRRLRAGAGMTQRNGESERVND